MLSERNLFGGKRVGGPDLSPCRRLPTAPPPKAPSPKAREQLQAGLDVAEETLKYNRRWVLIGTPVLTAADFVIGVMLREGDMAGMAAVEPRPLLVLAPALVITAGTTTWAVLRWGNRPYARHVTDLRAALAGAEAG